jgi:Na+/melibiose symporter-like transporter
LGDPTVIATTTAWRYGFIAPSAIAFLNMILWSLMVSHDSLFFLIDKRSEEDGFSQFKKVYSFSTVQNGLLAWQKMKEQRDKTTSQRTVEPSLIDIFSDRRYQRCTLFLILSAMINQFSGINAINIYSTTILSGIPGLSLTLGVYLLSGANVVGALMGPLVQSCFSIRVMLIAGQVVMALFLGGVVTFSFLNMPMLILVCMIGMIITY